MLNQLTLIRKQFIKYCTKSRSHNILVLVVFEERNNTLCEYLYFGVHSQLENRGQFSYIIILEPKRITDSSCGHSLYGGVSVLT